MGDPVEWAAWIYGKSGTLGIVALGGALSLAGVLVIALVLYRGVEKYKESHPAPGLSKVSSAAEVTTALSSVREGQYRSLVADVIHAMEPNAFVAVGGEVIGPDGSRRVDVQVWSANREGGPAIIDVIDRPDGQPAGIEVVDHIDSKRRDLPVRAAIVSSNTGFTREAITKAKRTSIALITVLKHGDGRASVLEEEVYLRTIDVKFVRTNYTHPGQQKEVVPYEVKYRGVAVDGWLTGRLSNALNGLRTDRVFELYYRLKRPTDFNAPGGKIRNVTRISVRADVGVQWASQVVQLDATNAIYDYVRGRVKLGGKEATYSIRNVNWETAIPLREAPDVAPLGGALQPGEVEVFLMRIHGLALEKTTVSKVIDDLIEPDDLKLELEPVGMTAKP